VRVGDKNGEASAGSLNRIGNTPPAMSSPPPLRLHVLSDLHIEHGGFVVPRVDCDIVVVAGDLANGRRMTKALADLSEQVRKPIIYVPGNHDWHQVDIASEQSSLVQAGAGGRRGTPRHRRPTPISSAASDRAAGRLYPVDSRVHPFRDGDRSDG